MKLNPDLIRAILVAYENLPYGGGEMIKIDGFTEDEINYHQEILLDAGFIKAHVAKFIGGGVVITPERLTFEGHEFLNASREDKRWNTVKTMMEKTGGIVIEVAKALLVSLLRDQLNLNG